MRFPSTLPALIGVVALAGCGGSDPPSADRGADASAVQPRGGVTLVAALGDSITAGAPLWDPDPTVRALLGGAADERSQYEYWVARNGRWPSAAATSACGGISPPSGPT